LLLRQTLLLKSEFSVLLSSLRLLLLLLLLPRPLSLLLLLLPQALFVLLRPLLLLLLLLLPLLLLLVAAVAVAGCGQVSVTFVAATWGPCHFTNLTVPRPTCSDRKLATFVIICTTGPGMYYSCNSCSGKVYLVVTCSIVLAKTIVSVRVLATQYFLGSDLLNRTCKHNCRC
jgi:hypothetical protein